MQRVQFEDARDRVAALMAAEGLGAGESMRLAEMVTTQY